MSEGESATEERKAGLKESWRRRWWWCEILNPVVNEGLAEKLTFEPRPERGNREGTQGRASAKEPGLGCWEAMGRPVWMEHWAGRGEAGGRWRGG